MRTIRRDKVYNRLFVSQIVREINPVYVVAQPGIEGCFEEHPPRDVQRWITHITTACDVDGTEVEWQPNQVVLQRPGDKFVDLITGGSCKPADDCARCLFCIGDRLSSGKRVTRCIRIIQREWIQEGLKQAQLGIIADTHRVTNLSVNVIEIRVVTLNRLGQHGVPEAIN